jgi:hypothetical protein
MELRKVVMTITRDEWQDKLSRGLAAVVQDRPYIMTLHESTTHPVYHPVRIAGDESPADGA